MIEFDPEFDLPRLAVGTHDRDSGFACAMNALSWLDGDDAITDHPASVYRFLADMIIAVNDTICTHLDKVTVAGSMTVNPISVLCNSCSNIVWKLNARVIGTGGVSQSKDLDLEIILDVMKTIALRLNPELEYAFALGAMLRLIRNAFKDPTSIIKTSRMIGSTFFFAPEVEAPQSDKWSDPFTEVMYIDTVEHAKGVIGNYGSTQATQAQSFLYDFLVKVKNGTNLSAYLDTSPAALVRIMTASVPVCQVPGVGVMSPLEQFEVVIAAFEKHTGYRTGYAFTRADNLKLINEAKLVTV